MALASISICQHYSRRVSFSLLWLVRATLKHKCGTNTCVERTLMSATSDVLDSFTDELSRKKSDKWKFLNRQKAIQCANERSLNDSNQNSLQEDFECYDINVNSLDELLTKVIRSKEYNLIIKILKFSGAKQLCPSPELLLEAASVLSRIGSRTGVEVVMSVCESLNKNEFYNQAEYKHYMAEATWIRGDIREALDMFAEVYKYHVTLRRKVRHMTKFLFAECVSKRSEASVVLVTNFAKKFAEEYGDYYFLSFLWQFCFLSEWFCDQKMADKLLEQYKELRALIMDRIKIIAVTALKQEEVEVVQRLLEVTLRYEMKQDYAHILSELFDFKCARGDLRGCSAVLTSSLELNVSLKPEQHDRFLALLLGLNRRNKQLPRQKQQQHFHKRLEVPCFQLKF